MDLLERWTILLFKNEKLKKENDELKAKIATLEGLLEEEMYGEDL